MAVPRLPGEYRRRSLVTIEMDAFQAQLFVPEKLEAQRRARPGQALIDSVAVEEHYIVTTHRLDGVWDFTIIHDGQEIRIPGQVFERMAAQRETIITEGRKVSAKASAKTRLSKIAEEDQAEATALEADKTFRLLTEH